MLMFNNVLLQFFYGVFQYLLFLPIFLIIGIIIFSDSELLIWLLSLYGLFIVGVVFRTLFFKQKWWLFSFFSIIVGVASSFIFADVLLFVIILAMIHILIVYRGMMYIGQTWEDVLPLSFLWLGSLGIYFAGYFIFRFVESLNPYLNYITMFVIILLIMTMFVSYNDHLKYTSLS